MKIAHIINPVNVDKSSDLYIAQPITFESLKNAKNIASEAGLKVKLLATCYDEDISMVPKEFEVVDLLKNSVNDINGKLPKKPKLPLLKDILDRLYNFSEGYDILIYTNADIAVQPHFYLAIKEIILQGFNSFTINKRIISEKYNSIENLKEMYQEKGRSHPGADCFVFKRELYPSFHIDNVCLGRHMFDKSLLWNLMAFGKPFKIFGDRFLTFHIGNDRAWTRQPREYFLHNENCLKNVIKHIENINGSVFEDKLLNFQMMIGENKKVYERLDLKLPESIKILKNE